jgi:hypothetical protein
VYIVIRFFNTVLLVASSVLCVGVAVRLVPGVIQLTGFQFEHSAASHFVNHQSAMTRKICHPRLPRTSFSYRYFF